MVMFLVPPGTAKTKTSYQICALLTAINVGLETLTKQA